MIRIKPMIPLRDNIPTRTIPIIATGLIFVNMLIFFWQRFALPPSVSAGIYKYYGLVPYEFTAAIQGHWDLIPYNVATIFTSMFLHGGFFHVGGNMLYLFIFGNNIEDAFGHFRFFIFYLLAGLAAAVFQFLYDPLSTVPMIGASGAISGILGAYLVLFPFARIKTLIIILIFFKTVELPAILFLTIWFIIQIAYSASTEGVAWYAHIGGFLFGLIAAKLFERRPGSRSRYMGDEA